jgi:hypothetical protein
MSKHIFHIYTKLAMVSEGSNTSETLTKTKELAQLADDLGYNRLACRTS